MYKNKILPDNVLVQRLRCAAKKYACYAGNDVLVIYGKNKNGPFYAYEFYAGRENFQHLAGVKYPKGAKLFFERCIDDINVISCQEIVPAVNKKVTSSKIEILTEAIDLKKAKAYKAGRKDLITLHNSFELALGNKQSVLGLDKRSYHLPVPVTVINGSIYDYCSEVFTIYLIMLKQRNEVEYTTVFYEITTEILKKISFNEQILSKIRQSR